MSFIDWIKRGISMVSGTAVNQNKFYDDEYDAMYTYMYLWNAYYQNKADKLLACANNDDVYKNATVTYPALYRVCNKIATLVFSELPRFTFDEKSQKRMDYIIDKNHLFEKLRLGQTEVCGIGNVYIKINVDTENKDYPIIELVRALDAAPALVDWGDIRDVTFYSLKRQKEKIHWWLAQTYTENDAGTKILESKLYKGDSINLGTEHPLTDIEETEDIKPVIDLKTKSPWFIHVKSPMPNNKDPQSPLGMSISANSLDQIDHINLTMQSYFKDDKLKQPKAAVSEDLVTTTKRNGALEHNVDFWDEFYIALKSGGGDALYKIIDMKSKQKDFEESLQGKLDRYYESCGLFRSSIQKNSGAKTATEWELADKDSAETGADYKNAWLNALDTLFRSIMEIDNVYFTKAGVKNRTRHKLDQDITIEFMDSVKNDQAQKANTAKELYSAGMSSLTTALMDIHPDWNEVRVQKEIKMINAESANRAKVTEIDFYGSNSE